MSSQFSDRLDMLFKVFLQPPSSNGRRKEYSCAEVARIAAEVSGQRSITRQYLSMLRSGERTNASLELAFDIAQAFAQLSEDGGSPASAERILAYLANESAPSASADSDQVLVQLTAPAVAQHDKVGVLARLAELDDPAALQSVSELIDQLHEETGPRRLARRLRLRP